jgi:hypothetical protein
MENGDDSEFDSERDCMELVRSLKDFAIYLSLRHLELTLILRLIERDEVNFSSE